MVTNTQVTRFAWHGLPARETAPRAAGSRGTGFQPVGSSGTGVPPVFHDANHFPNVRKMVEITPCQNIGESPVPLNPLNPSNPMGRMPMLPNPTGWQPVPPNPLIPPTRYSLLATHYFFFHP